MKNLKVLLLALFAILANSAFAQAADFDETTLIGQWTVTSMTGAPNNYVKSFDGFYLGDCHFDGSYDDWARGDIGGYIINLTFNDGDGHDHHSIKDFFISNNNKLHIILVDDHYDRNYTFRFVIENLTPENMTLKSYDGSCLIELNKEGSSSSVMSAELHPGDTQEFYNLKGLKVNNPREGEIYVKRSGTDAEKIKF